MADETTTTTTKKKRKAAPKKPVDPCANATKSKKLRTHMNQRPERDDPCYPAWQKHAAWLANEEGVQLGPM